MNIAGLPDRTVCSIAVGFAMVAMRVVVVVVVTVVGMSSASLAPARRISFSSFGSRPCLAALLFSCLVQPSRLSGIAQTYSWLAVANPLRRGRGLLGSCHVAWRKPEGLHLLCAQQMLHKMRRFRRLGRRGSLQKANAAERTENVTLSDFINEKTCMLSFPRELELLIYFTEVCAVAEIPFFAFSSQVVNLAPSSGSHARITNRSPSPNRS